MAAPTNAQQLGSAVSIAAGPGRGIQVTVPRHAGAVSSGTVTLYRASDPAADRTFTFSPDAAGVQVVPVVHLAAGHWIVKLQWTADGHDYYVEQAIVLP